MNKPDKAFSDVLPNDTKTHIVEFRFPNAQANTYVLARRHFKGGVEVGEPIESRGGKVYKYIRLEETPFNVKGCTGKTRLHDSAAR